jgi:hypothetical protein
MKHYQSAHVKLFHGDMIDNVFRFVALVKSDLQLTLCLVIKLGVELRPVESECHLLFREEQDTTVVK